MKKVGIIGGIGPEATVDYYKSIIKLFQTKVNSKTDLPEMVINSINPRLFTPKRKNPMMT